MSALRAMRDMGAMGRDMREAGRDGFMYHLDKTAGIPVPGVKRALFILRFRVRVG